MIMLIEKSYDTEQEVFNAYSDKFTKLCNQIINEMPYGKTESLSEMNISAVIHVDGKWLHATMYFTVERYETLNASPDAIYSDELDDYYGHTNLDELRGEYGDKVRAIDSLSDDEIKKLIDM